MPVQSNRHEMPPAKGKHNDKKGLCIAFCHVSACNHRKKPN